MAFFEFQMKVLARWKSGLSVKLMNGYMNAKFVILFKRQVLLLLKSFSLLCGV